MTRLALREIARWGRAVGAPLVMLGAVGLGPALLPSGPMSLVRDGTHSIGQFAMLAAAATWLLVAGVRTGRQPPRDRHAAERLQSLRDRAAGPSARLLCVERSLWQSRAGQRLVASDVRTGAVMEVWLAESALSPGTFAVVTTARQSTLVDWISPETVAAARRAEQREAARHRARVARVVRLNARRQRKAAAEVVRAAEGLLR